MRLNAITEDVEDTIKAFTMFEARKYHPQVAEWKHVICSNFEWDSPPKLEAIVKKAIHVHSNKTASFDFDT